MHTPGPWSFKDGFVLAVGPVNDPEGDAVAHIVDHPLEAFDNARLIAAAPDLLEALKVMWAMYREDDNEATDQARAALDQAVSFVTEV
jgi:phage gp36-like protein